MDIYIIRAFAGPYAQPNKNKKREREISVHDKREETRGAKQSLQPDCVGMAFVACENPSGFLSTSNFSVNYFFRSFFLFFFFAFMADWKNKYQQRRRREFERKIERKKTKSKRVLLNLKNALNINRMEMSCQRRNLILSIQLWVECTHFSSNRVPACHLQ